MGDSGGFRIFDAAGRPGGQDEEDQRIQAAAERHDKEEGIMRQGNQVKPVSLFQGIESLESGLPGDNGGIPYREGAGRGP